MKQIALTVLKIGFPLFVMGYVLAVRFGWDGFNPFLYLLSFFSLFFILFQLLYSARMTYRDSLSINRVYRLADNWARRWMRIGGGVIILGVVVVGASFPFVGDGPPEGLLKVAIVGGLILLNIGFLIYMSGVVKLLFNFTEFLKQRDRRID